MPILTETSEKYGIKCLWNEKLQYNFNVLVAKKVFRNLELCLVTGSDNGNVRVHKSIKKGGSITSFEKDGQNYETKGGSIQTLLSENVTKFSSQDILVGDTNGLFTIITNGQILNRRCLCDSKISVVVMDTDSAGNTHIVVGSCTGTIVSVTPYEILWKCRLSEALKQEQQVSGKSLSITAMHIHRMQSTSIDSSYIVIADTEKRIHFFQNEVIVLTLNVPSIVTSMCTGHFINDDVTVDSTQNTTTKGQRYSNDEQIAMATKSGAVFVMSNFSIVPYTNLSYPITQLKRIPASGVDDVDAVLCCGNFNKLCILQNRICVSSFETDDWIHTIDLIDEDFRNGSLLLVIGCVDSSVKLFRLDKNR